MSQHQQTRSLTGLLLTDMVLILPIFSLLMVLITYLHPIYMDEDLGRHIKLGNIILQTHSVPRINLLSYTNTEFAFINHHWLSEVVYALLYQITGPIGILLISCGLMVLAFLLFYILLRRKLHPLAFLLVTLLGLITTLQRTEIRPEIFSYTFLLLITAILYRNKQRATLLVWIIPVIMVFWVNLHIYFPLGIAVLGCFFIGEIWENKQSLRNRTVPPSLKTLTAILVLSTVATLCNPSGIKGALYPFFIYGNYGYKLNESEGIVAFQQALFTVHKVSPAIIVFFSMLSCIGLISLLRKKYIALTDILLIICFSSLPFFAIRFLGAWYYALAAPLCLTASSTINEYQHHFVQKKLYVYFFISLCLFALSLIIITDHGIKIGIKDPDQHALDFYKTAHLKGPLFNNFDIGSYIEFRLYPQEKSFIDERPEAYPTSFFNNIYIPMQENKDIFDQQVKKFNINTIIFRHTESTTWGEKFLYQISHNKDWILVYLDDTVVIYVRNVPKNKDIIAKYGMDREHLRLGYIDTTDTISLLQLAHFFSDTRWGEKEAVVLQQVLSLDPYNCDYLGRILNIYANNPNNSFVAQFQNDYSLHCK